MKHVAVVLTLLWAAVAAADLPVGEQVIHLKDGRELRGVITSQTEQGYWVQSSSGNELVLFANIQDILPTESAPPPPPVAPPPPPPVEPVANPAPAPDEPPPEVEAALPDWRADRKGFHWTAGAGGMVDPGVFGGSSSASPTVAGYVAGFAAIRWGFGWLDVQAELMPLGYFKGATKALFLGANPQLRINFARFYSLGVGVYGAVVMSPGIDFLLGASFSPAIFRFGELGQHEIRLWLAAPVVATSAALRSGVTLFLLSYAYVF